VLIDTDSVHTRTVTGLAFLPNLLLGSDIQRISGLFDRHFCYPVTLLHRTGGSGYQRPFRGLGWQTGQV